MIKELVRELEEKLDDDLGVGQDILDHPIGVAIRTIGELQDFAIWMTGFYEFTQHEYFIKQRDKLLK
jgi:hypothetical protein